MDKLYLSMKEGAELAGIGQNEFRSLMSRPGAPILQVGTKRYVERAGIAPFLRGFQTGAQMRNETAALYSNAFQTATGPSGR